MEAIIAIENFVHENKHSSMKDHLSKMSLEEILTLCHNNTSFQIPRRGKSTRDMYKKILVAKIVTAHEKHSASWHYKTKYMKSSDIKKSSLENARLSITD